MTKLKTFLMESPMKVCTQFLFQISYVSICEIRTAVNCHPRKQKPNYGICYVLTSLTSMEWPQIKDAESMPWK